MMFLVALELVVLVAAGAFTLRAGVPFPASEDIGTWASAAVSGAIAHDARPYALPPAPLRDGPLAPVKKDADDVGVVLAAASAVAVDQETGATLFEKDPDRVHSIASITKLMTALVVAERAPDWSARVTLLKEDLRGGGIEYLIPGETATVRDLFSAMLVASSNTAAAALARSTGLSEEEFVALMNAKAGFLGLETSRFADPTGLDADNRGSARDVAVLVQAALAVPDIAAAVRTRTYTIMPGSSRGTARRILHSTDLLLGGMLDHPPFTIAGGKTGTLGAQTGYHLAVSVGSGDIGSNIIIVILGSDTHLQRFEDAKALAFWTFQAYDWSTTRPVASSQ